MHACTKRTCIVHEAKPVHPQNPEGLLESKSLMRGCYVVG